jgi:hypothetical protein
MKTDIIVKNRGQGIRKSFNDKTSDINSVVCKAIPKYEKVKQLAELGVLKKSSLVQLAEVNNSSFYMVSDNFSDRENQADVSSVIPPAISKDSRDHFYRILFEAVKDKDLKKLIFYGGNAANVIESLGDCEVVNDLKSGDLTRVLFELNSKVIVIKNSERLIENAQFFKIMSTPLYDNKVTSETGDSFVFSGSIIFISNLNKFPTNFNIISVKSPERVIEKTGEVVTYIGGSFLEKYSIKQLDILYANLIRESEQNFLIDAIERETFKRIKYSKR